MARQRTPIARVPRRPRPPGVARALLPLLVAVLGSAVPLLLPGPAQALAAPAEAPPAVLAGPPLTFLTWHPYPDPADPLGFPYPAGSPVGYYAREYAAYVQAKGLFAFPYLVADGLDPIEGLPDPARPYEATRAAYEAAWQARSALDAPATLRVATRLAGQLEVVGTVLPTAPLAGADLHARVALVEDHVYYQPPPSLTNGVLDHRFTVRDVADLGPVDLSRGAPVPLSHAFALKPGWRTDQLYVALWLQQEAHQARFEPHEVAQATLHRALDNRATVQATKGVLMEMLSATWCATCRYGDKVAEEMAQAHSLPELGAPPAAHARYLQAPSRVPFLVATAVAAGGLAAFSGRRQP